MRWFADTDNDTNLPVRAIIAFLFTGGVVAGFLLGLLTPADFKELALVVFMWYFAKKSTQDLTNGNGNGDDTGLTIKSDVTHVNANDVKTITPTAQHKE